MGEIIPRAERSKPETDRQRAVREELEARFADRDYMEAYIEDTDRRVEDDPQLAVGGMWEEIGMLQRNFLIEEGLQPHHRLLDIGCGTLRAGRLLIPYLKTGNYTGFDISPKAIEHSKILVENDAELRNREPELYIDRDRGLRFKEHEGEKFDYLIAQSVFTHLHPDSIQQCFSHIQTIMHECSRFYFTHNQADRIEAITVKVFCQPLDWYEQIAAHHGYYLIDRSKDFPHPRGQNIILAQKMA